MGDSLDFGGGGSPSGGAGPVSSGASSSNVFGEMPSFGDATSGLTLNVLLVAAVGVVLLLVLVLVLKR